MIEYELDVVIGENVAAITAKLPEMSETQLADLAEMERAAKAPRKGLLDAIAAEQAGRADENGAADGGADAGAPDAGGDTKDQVIAAQQARIEALEAALGASEAGGGKPSRKARDPKAVVFQSGPVDFGSPVLVAFADENGAQLSQIPALVFSADDFSISPDAGAVALDRAIAFPVHGPANDVCAVWAVGKDGKTGMRCGLVAPLATGGGRGAEIPAGHLYFTV